MTAPAPLDEHSRRQALARMKLVATGLLIVALAVFVVAKAARSRHTLAGLCASNR